MAVPLALAIPAALGMTWTEIAAGVGLSGVLTYLAYDDVKVPNLFGSAPTGKNTVDVPFGSKPTPLIVPPVSPSVPSVPSVPVAPSMSKTLSPTLDDYLKSLNRQKTNTQSLASTLTTAGTAVKERNDALAQTAGASKFLVNQVEGKAAIDEVSFAINAQSVVHAMIYETLDRNLSLISAALVASAQTVKVQTDVIRDKPVPVSPDYSSQMERLAARADSAKIVDDHAHTVRDVKDLDGLTIARAAPMEIKAIREATQAREKTDIINETFDDFDNPLGGLDLMPLLNFVGRGDAFDTSKTLSNLFKPDGV